MSDKPRMTVRILFKPEGNITWKEFIRYDTKEEAISYLENVNPTLRPALITSGESTLRAYDVGIIDYQDIAKMEHEFNTLQQESKQAIDRIKLRERFLSKVKFTNTCWNWTGSLATDNYGQFWDGEKQHTAHRFSYMIFVGDIPNDKHIDHLCRNHSCVNPAHLEAVTNKENILRGIGVTANNARKTHCKRGHLLEGDNLFIDTKTNQRMCKTCKSLRNRKII